MIISMQPFDDGFATSRGDIASYWGITSRFREDVMFFFELPVLTQTQRYSIWFNSWVAETKEADVLEAGTRESLWYFLDKFNTQLRDLRKYQSKLKVKNPQLHAV